MILATEENTAKQINNSKVGIVPTDTLYGIVCDATNKEAVKRLYALKSRENKPGTLIASSVTALEQLGLKKRYLKAVEQFWPNSISIIIPCGSELEYLHLGKNSLAVRIPKDADSLKFIGDTGVVLSSSANLAGEPEATNIEQARQYFGESVDFYMDGGDLSDRKPSTIIEIIDDTVNVLRKGAVNINEYGSIE